MRKDSARSAGRRRAARVVETARPFSPAELETIRMLAQDGAKRYADAEARARAGGWTETADAHADRARCSLDVLEALDGRPRVIVTEADRQAIRGALRNAGQ